MYLRESASGDRRPIATGGDGLSTGTASSMLGVASFEVGISKSELENSSFGASFFGRLNFLCRISTYARDFVSHFTYSSRYSEH